MPKPPTSVRSIRLPDDLWAQIMAEAEKRVTTVNKLMHSFAIVGLLKSAEGRFAAENPGQIAKPVKRLTKPAAKAEPVKAPANPPKLALQVGPAAVAAGSRLKKR